MTDPEPPLLHTARLRLEAMGPQHAAVLADFIRRNAAHFARWDPPRGAEVMTEAHWREQGRLAEEGRRAGRLLRWLAFRRDAADALVARANFTEIVRGPFQSCLLGYQVDAGAEGQGLMHETLATTIDYMFTQAHLHRIEANHRPENERSARLLARLGFTPIGTAPRYLFIDGAWRDHVLNQKLNPAFDDARLLPRS